MKGLNKEGGKERQGKRKQPKGKEEIDTQFRRETNFRVLCLQLLSSTMHTEECYHFTLELKVSNIPAMQQQALQFPSQKTHQSFLISSGISVPTPHQLVVECAWRWRTSSIMS